MNIIQELKRRHVFRVGITYLISAWLIIQVADLLIPMLDLSVSVSRLVLLLLAIGFVPTLIAAWALELTPQGIRWEKGVLRQASIAPRALDFVLIGVLSVTVVLLVVERVWTRGARVDLAGAAAFEKSIAVLPFGDLSQSRDQEWFADGLSEEIVNALAHTPDILVAARTSTFAYKNTDKDVPTIARQLGVAHVLEGSVRRAGDRLRVTAQLIRAADGFHLWSENYDRSVADMIDVQQDLALSIANALRTTMEPEALASMVRVGTRSVEAYQQYLRGTALRSDFFRTDDAQQMLDAYQHFETARRADPGFAAAHAASADFWQLQLTPIAFGSGLTKLTPAERRDNCMTRIEAAIATASDATDRLGYEARKAAIELRLRDAIRLYRSYLAARPNESGAWFEYLSLAFSASDREAIAVGLEHVRIAGEHDVDSAQWYLNFAYEVIDPAAAADYGLAALERWPDHFGVLYQTHRTLLWAGRIDAGARLAARVDLLYPHEQRVRARQACAEGRRKDVLSLLAEIDFDTAGPSFKWLLLLMLGEKEQAIEVVRAFESAAVPYEVAAWLAYHSFDPSPFPGLMRVLERERVERLPAATIPFACPAR